MFAYDKTFDPKIVLGHYDLISRFSDLPYMVKEYTVSTICLCMTRPLTEVFLGHCGLISWFSDFALYLDTRYFLLLLSAYE